jgi:hypothetical protein
VVENDARAHNSPFGLYRYACATFVTSVVVSRHGP